MQNLFQFLLLGVPAGAEGAAPGGAAGLMSFLPFVLIIAIFYFLIIRPQNKKQKDTQKMLESLKKGDKVVTIGGIHGSISSIDGTDVVVRVDDNTKIKFLRSAISSVTARDSEKSDKSDKIEDKKDEAVKTEAVEQKVEAKTT
jgi:preprotein translocase subunit YajC